jgi:S-adenosylmethionine:tRNA ribosyltransferase-isomerase
MRLEDFDYELPAELIAQHPPAQRSASRMLCVGGGALADRDIRELPALLDPGDVIVFNDTRVIKARLFGRKPSGGRVEMLIERLLGEREALAQLRASHKPRPGGRVLLEADSAFEVLGREGELYRLRIEGALPLPQYLERHGAVPLPPYIGRRPELEDESRYQTVYARVPGAVAASTAGLHFDQALLEALDARGVERVCLTLHIGAGTFQPVRDSDLSRHRMHREWFDLPAGTVAAIARARAARRRVVAVGTTVVRTLEAVAARGPLAATRGETDLFITPGFRFRVVDRMLTNFHLPRSTLLMLVSAFAGTDAIRAAYRHAVEARYRFFSYGDAMLLDRAPD